MFRYFSRLHESYGLPVYPVAVLSYESPKVEAAHEYTVEIDGWRVLWFQFQALQLNRMAWRDYIRNDNPVSLALAAKMAMDPSERRKVKFECLRLLWTMRLDPARMELIIGFINSYLVLNQEDEQWLEEEMANAIPERKPEKVLFWTHWHERGWEKGVKDGQIETVKRFLSANWRRRFAADLPDPIAMAAESLELERLTELADAVFDFQSPADADAWLANHSAR